MDSLAHWPKEELSNAHTQQLRATASCHYLPRRRQHIIVFSRKKGVRQKWPPQFRQHLAITRPRLDDTLAEPAGNSPCCAPADGSSPAARATSLALSSLGITCGASCFSQRPLRETSQMGLAQHPLEPGEVVWGSGDIAAQCPRCRGEHFCPTRARQPCPTTLQTHGDLGREGCHGRWGLGFQLARPTGEVWHLCLWQSWRRHRFLHGYEAMRWTRVWG